MTTLLQLLLQHLFDNIHIVWHIQVTTLVCSWFLTVTPVTVTFSNLRKLVYTQHCSDTLSDQNKCTMLFIPLDMGS